MSPFVIPVKKITSPAQLEIFQSSSTHNDITTFVAALNNAVVGKKRSDPCVESESLKSVVALLEAVQQIAVDTPPVDNKASRFGNPAFKTFYDRVQEASTSLHTKYLPGIPQESIPELSIYFTECWGNKIRIDYGSGMELNFLMWLMCLFKLDVWKEEDMQAVVLRVFWKYIDVMRYLQKTYWLEPAGSHGVWGLDDYHFLPFLFGSGQLKGHKYLRPKSIHDADILATFSNDYMYFSAIAFINAIKSASLRWHSPMLDDISAVKTWDKVNSGMHKMYAAEVLNKLPVAQHIYFGSLLPAPEGIDKPHDHDKDDTEGGPKAIKHGDHFHAASNKGMLNLGDCCGIPIPSAFAAGLADHTIGLRKGADAMPAKGSASLRPLPVD